MASTYCSWRRAMTLPRTIRPNSGTVTTTMAMTIEVMPGPRATPMPRASRIPGKENITSKTRIRVLSSQPPT